MNTLFWNLHDRPLELLVAQLAAEHSIDLIVLAEPDGINDTRLVRELSSRCEGPFLYHFWEPQPRLRFYSRYSPSAVVPLADTSGISVRKITSPGCLPLILVAVHSPSPQYWSEPGDRLTLASRIRFQLESAESGQAHRRSVVLGDFNTDPFDAALANSDGLHGVMAKTIAMQRSRVVLGQTCHFLYNPMFSLLGDISAGPPGSYFYRKATASCRFWHLFDQVLFRPEIVPAFDPQSLSIITTVGGVSLAKPSGEPDNDVGSDHFPLTYSLDLLGNFADVG